MPRLLTLCLLPALLLAASAPPAAARGPQNGPDTSALAWLPRSWHRARDVAYLAFGRERNPHPGCFTVRAQIVGNALSVNFTPGWRTEQGRHLRGGRTSCGRDVTFLVARNGALLRRTYSR